MARILIIEDEPVSRKLLASFFAADHEVVLAGEGNEGLRLFREHPADIVITDVFMPGKEGVETVRELLRDFPDTPVIAVTGGGSRVLYDSLDWMQVLGVKRTFTKPLDRATMRAAVAELLAE